MYERTLRKMMKVRNLYNFIVRKVAYIEAYTTNRKISIFLLHQMVIKAIPNGCLDAYEVKVNKDTLSTYQAKVK